MFYMYLQNHSYALRLSAQKGLLPAFQHFCRKIPSNRNVSKQDDSGYCLLHHAAMNNRPSIIVLLLQQGFDINVRRHNLTSVGKDFREIILLNKFMVRYMF